MTAASVPGPAASSRTVVRVALLGNLGVAVTKLLAALFTSSSAMLSEAIHSLVDTLNEVLLMYGMHRSSRPADHAQPFGYGRELYFWSFIVATLIFTVGAGAAAWNGTRQFLRPQPIERPVVLFAVLAISALFEGWSWWISLKAARSTFGDGALWHAIRRSKDPPKFMVLLEDTAALVGIAIATLGAGLALAFEDLRFDAAASWLIALLLAGVAFVIMRETKSLLIGERAHPKLTQGILELARTTPGVARANGVLTAQVGPDRVLAFLSAEFDDAMHIKDLEQIIELLEDQTKAMWPEVDRLFVKPQTASAHARKRAELRSGKA